MLEFRKIKVVKGIIKILDINKFIKEILNFSLEARLVI